MPQRRLTADRLAVTLEHALGDGARSATGRVAAAVRDEDGVAVALRMLEDSAVRVR